jgi:hypothetical protein
MVFEGNKVKNTKFEKHTDNISHRHKENKRKYRFEARAMV